MDDAVSVPTTFTKNRDRLLEGDIARAFFEDVVAQARGGRLLSAEHFTVDGTLLEVWAGQKSSSARTSPLIRPTSRAILRSSSTASAARIRRMRRLRDPESRLFKEGEGHEAKLAYLGEVQMEAGTAWSSTRACLSNGAGGARRALSLIASLPARRVPIGGDRGYDTRGFVETLRQLEATPHVAPKTKSRAIDGGTTRHPATSSVGGSGNASTGSSAG